MLFEERLDFFFDLLDRGHAGLVLIIHADDVVTILRLNQIADLSLIQRERSLLELRHHGATLEKSQRAAVDGAGFVVGFFLGQLFEIGAGAQLLENVFCLFASGCIGRGAHFAIRPGLGLDEDVAGLYLFLLLKLALMLVVVAEQLRW